MQNCFLISIENIQIAVESTADFSNALPLKNYNEIRSYRDKVITSEYSCKSDFLMEIHPFFSASVEEAPEKIFLLTTGLLIQL